MGKQFILQRSVNSLKNKQNKQKVDRDISIGYEGARRFFFFIFEAENKLQYNYNGQFPRKLSMSLHSWNFAQPLLMFVPFKIQPGSHYMDSYSVYFFDNILYAPDLIS